MSSFLPTNEHRYEVTPEHTTTSIYFDTFEEADHYARLNAGMIVDLDTLEIVRVYTEDYEN